MAVEPEPPSDERTYSAREAAALLGVSPDAILRKCKDGTLREVDRPGRATQIARQDVEQLRFALLGRLQASDARPQADDLSASKSANVDATVETEGKSRDLARIRELEEHARGLKSMLEVALDLIGQRLVGDSLND